MPRVPCFDELYTGWRRYRIHDPLQRGFRAADPRGARRIHEERSGRRAAPAKADTEYRGRGGEKALPIIRSAPKHDGRQSRSDLEVEMSTNPEVDPIAE